MTIPPMRSFLLFFGFLCIGLLAGVLVFQRFIWKPEQLESVDLAAAIPSHFEGWKVQDQPLASSEEMQARAESLLNFTDVIFRTYQQGDTEIAVYIAYWEPRKMPVRLVHAHTPDICWVGNGWSVAESGYSVNLESKERPLKPAEFRAMSRDSMRQYVYYWHVIGDRVFVNRIVGAQDRLVSIKSLLQLGLNQQREQFFIRVNSNKPFEQLWHLPLMQAIMSDLADLALIEGAAPVDLENKAKALQLAEEEPLS